MMKTRIAICCAAMVVLIVALGVGCADRNSDDEKSVKPVADSQAESVADDQAEPDADNQTEPGADDQADTANTGEGVPKTAGVNVSDVVDMTYVDEYVATTGGIDLSEDQAAVSNNLYHEFYSTMPEVKKAEL